MNHGQSMHWLGVIVCTILAGVINTIPNTVSNFRNETTEFFLNRHSKMESRFSNSMNIQPKVLCLWIDYYIKLCQYAFNIYATSKRNHIIEIFLKMKRKKMILFRVMYTIYGQQHVGCTLFSRNKTEKKIYTYIHMTEQM